MNGSFGFAYADLNDGEFRLMQVQDKQSLVRTIWRALRRRNYW